MDAHSDHLCPSPAEKSDVPRYDYRNSSDPTSISRPSLPARSATGSINDYPPEIVFEILATLIHVSSARSFLKCALVCRAWRDTILPLFYYDTVVFAHELKSFCDTFNPEYSSYIHSFTLTMKEEGMDCQDFGDTVNNDMSRLPVILSSCTNISTFSYTADFIETDIPSYISDLVSLLNALPDTCVNLELDIADGLENDTDAHLCTHLRPLLSRMKHVRLRLNRVCPTLLGTFPHPLSSAYTGDVPSFRPISLPKIETLVICSDFNYFSSWEGSECEFWDPHTEYGQFLIKSAFQRLVEAKEYLPSAKLSLVTWANATTIIATDMISQTSLVFPCSSMCQTVIEHLLLRTRHMQDIVASTDDVQLYVEGQIWRSTTLGSRLPTAVLNSSRTPLSRVCSEALRLMSVDEARKAYPHLEFRLLENEALAGMPLLAPEIRAGPLGHLDFEPIYEMTPPGFMRSQRDFGYRLWQDGTSDQEILETLRNQRELS